jgi:hypothetical protein
MRQRLNKRRPRHTEPYARPQRRESLSAKIEASDSAAIPLAPARRYLGTDLNRRSDRPDWILEVRAVVNRTPCIFKLTPPAVDLARLYGWPHAVVTQATRATQLRRIWSGE